MTPLQWIGVALIFSVPLALFGAMVRGTGWRDTIVVVLVLLTACGTELLGLLLLSGQVP